jgi:hypothetical protein
MLCTVSDRCPLERKAGEGEKSSPAFLFSEMWPSAMEKNKTPYTSTPRI